MIKDIVVNLSVNTEGGPAGAYAVSVAAALDAHLAAIAFLYDPILPISGTGYIPAEVIETQQADNEAAAKAALDRFTEAARRAGLSAERLRVYWEGDDAKDHAAMLAELRAALVAPISETGDEARFPYPPGREARLVREAGQWKIEDPDQNHVVTTSEH